MPAHAINLKDPQSALRVLLALVVQAGGELRCKAVVYDQLDKGRLLTIDFDRRKSQIVIRATSDLASAVPVAPEAHQWVMPPSAAPLERARVVAEHEAEIRNIPSDEQLAEMEERIAANQKLARDVKEGKNPLRLKTVK
jgi:hypothetical protein